MNRVQNLVAYLCLNYPYPNELTNARITKMIYLSDWFSSLVFGRQLTRIEWLFNHYGPYVEDVIDNVAMGRDNFKIKRELNLYGTDRSLVVFIGNSCEVDVCGDDIEILDLVIKKTKGLYFRDFVNYVYSTYPIRNSTRYSVLDLPKLASEFIESNERDSI